MNRKSFLLLLLLIIFTFNFVDRQILALSLQSIKSEFGLSDTQAGFLTGMAFALFYSIMGIPIARWADTGNRSRVISITTALWSVMVIVCGLVGNFAQLLLARVGVAIGEAGAIPPAHSLIADHFPRSERARAVSIYMLGGPLSIIVGNFFGGGIIEAYGWRAAFIILGAPGLLFALLAHLCIRETRQNKVYDKALNVDPRTASAVDSYEGPWWRPVVKLMRHRTFSHLTFAFTIFYFFGYGVSLWIPSFYIRSHGISISELGLWMAVIWGLGAGAGTYFGGWWASRYAQQNEQFQLAAASAVTAIYALVTPSIYIVPNKYLSFGLMGVSAFVVSSWSGPVFAILQTIVQARMRALAVAIIYFVANLVGMGLGPLVAGFASDILSAWFADQSLRYALALISPGFIWAAIHLRAASKSIKQDIAGLPCEGDPEPDLESGNT